MAVDRSDMISEAELAKSGYSDAAELTALAVEARRFLLAHEWCKAVDEIWLDGGMKYLTVFLAHIKAKHPIDDDQVWVVVGEMPPAYFDTSVHKGADVLEVYSYWIREWAQAVLAGRPTDDLMPIYCSGGGLDPAPEDRELAKSHPSGLHRPSAHSRLRFVPERRTRAMMVTAEALRFPALLVESSVSPNSEPVFVILWSLKGRRA